MAAKQLQELQGEQPSLDERVDISTVKIDMSLPAAQRAEQYLAQIKNPYAFKCAGFAVDVVFSDEGKPLEEAIQSYLLAQKNNC